MFGPGTARPRLGRFTIALLWPAALVACAAEAPQPEAPVEADESPPSVQVVDHATDTVRLVADVEPGAVVAYASWSQHHVYIDRDFRDAVHGLLNAHISVSTGHWRIPLPGDDPAEPLIPGAPEREFEEFGIEQWDPATRAGLGDFRIVRGDAVSLLIVPACDAGASRGFAGGPWQVTVGQRGEGLVREDFVVLGTVDRLGPDCGPAPGALTAVMWAARVQGTGGD